VGESVHGVCGACGSGILVEDGLIIGRDDADLLAALEETVEDLTGLRRSLGPMELPSESHARAAIAKAKGSEIVAP